MITAITTLPSPKTRRNGVDSRRESILAAALTVFALRSFDGASTREIAQRANVTQPLLSYHFSSKEALWQEVVNALFAELNRALDVRANGLEGVDDLTTAKLLIREFIRFCAGKPQLLQIITGECKSEGNRMDWLVDNHIRPIYDRTIIMWANLQQTGIVASISPINFYYILIGAGATMFALGAECRRLTGLDTADPAVVENHIDAVTALLFGPPAI